MSGKSILREKTFRFSVDIVKLLFDIQSKKKEYNITGQLIKSATSIGANIREAQGAISPKEFIAKLHISYKEALETEYWLELSRELGLIPEKEVTMFLNQIGEILAIVTASIKTIKSKNAISS